MKNEKKYMLIVDDVEMNRAIIKEIFKNDYGIIETSNGKDALDIIRKEKKNICAVILDIIMPIMDGTEVLRQLYEDGTVNELPIFIITSNSDNGLIKKAYELGVMDVIEKPIISYIVKRRIKSVIELYIAREKLDDEVLKQKEELFNQSQKIIELNKGMIEALSAAIEFRSVESGEHVNRIHDMTEILLSQTELGDGIPENEVKKIALAAVMHDIGKIAIPDRILNKPGKLTKEEYEEMKLHTVYGCEMLEKIPRMRNNEAYEYAYDIARHHHERWDGKGYPDGLKGDEISIWSQIVSIADVYDALTCKRVYKNAIEADEVRRMILEGECGTFNPRLLKIFFENEDKIRRLYGEEN